MTADYGFFSCAFTAADAVNGSTEQAQLLADEVGLFWVELRPEESGRSVLLWRSWQGDNLDLTPQPFSVHSRVYEYGGKSWCLLGSELNAEPQSGESQALASLAFVNGGDQQVWLQRLFDGEASQPLQLTHQADCRYGDLLYDSCRQRIIAVQEKAQYDPTQPQHALVAICLETGAISYLARGQDFYASPTLDTNSNKLAWVSWSHPDMSWVKAELQVAVFDHEGSLSKVNTLNERSLDSISDSVQQPRFQKDGSVTALSDSSGWWNFYSYTPDFDSSANVRILSGNKPNGKFDFISQPKNITYAVADNEVAHGFLYLPETISGNDSKPPLLVFTHGGPTATTYAVFSPKIQYWTQRGFAVADLNYRGSAGFGRDYRLRLAGQWGVTDVEDVVAAADYLANLGLTDSRNVFIRGGSAGGYTTLCALSFSDRFQGGASYYGVSDPITLTKDTHKFESHYMDWLIGDPELDFSTYQARSPLLAADRISCPMIFFQGGQDKIVVEDQTERMVEALRTNDIEVEYHCYPEEQHGFRSSSNQIHCLEAELAFYQTLLSW